MLFAVADSQDWSGFARVVSVPVVEQHVVGQVLIAESFEGAVPTPFAEVLAVVVRQDLVP